MENHQCKKCHVIIQTDGRPKSGNCPEGLSHDWRSLGDCGDKKFQCKKCHTVIDTDGCPQSGYCPEGLSHDWRKLS